MTRSLSDRSCLNGSTRAARKPSDLSGRRTSLPDPARPTLSRLLAACALSFFFTSVSPAQTPGGSDVVRPAGAVYDLVALRVEFQPDSSRFSTGDGTFDGRLFDVDEELQVDPLPHDAGYFGAHLDFLESYVERVSDGRTRIRTHLLPVVRVSGPLADYAPIGQNADSPEQIARLAALVEEAWTLADAQGIALPAGLAPSTTAFAIFHAGVGRDVDLLGTTLDKTPEDLPSLFFSEDALRRHLDVLPTADGVTVSNTMILPRTESRQGVNPITDEPFVLGLSINGLLAASFLNYLGVPDLFDTETGRSAIGPFGVMDALGIFAYNGLFPPEPSAWTKKYLGWSNLYEITDGLIELRHSGHPELNETARVPISDSEYFLVENRHRDPEDDGVALTVYRNGELVVERFDNGDPEFNDQTIDGFGGGVVVDVDHYDFALPGGIDENDNPLVGGALIWHVDENRLRAGLEDNAVNVGPENRAVDLEEADGPQDIGYPSTSDFGPQFELGTPFDFWFEGNPVSVVTQTGGTVRLYENRFGPDTTPTATTNAGGPAFVEIYDFSPAGPTMTISVRPSDDAPVRPDRGRELVLEADLGGFGVLRLLDGADPAALQLFGGGRVFVVDPTPGGILSGTSVFPVVPLVEDESVVAVAADGVVRIDRARQTIVAPLPQDVDRAFGAVVQRGDGYEVPVVAAGTRMLFTTDGSLASAPDGLLARLFAETSDGTPVDGFVLEDRAMLGDSEWTFDRLSVASEWPEGEGSHLQTPIQVATVRDAAGILIAVSSPADGRLLLLSEDPAGARFVRDIDFSRISGSECDVSAPVFADLNGDKRAEAVVACNDRLIALHGTGSVVSGFPTRLSDPASTAPAVVFNEDGRASALVVGTSGGNVDAVATGDRVTRIPGFPIPGGLVSGVTPDVEGGYLAIATGAGRVNFFTFDDPESWASARGPFDETDNRQFVRMDAEPSPPAPDSDGLLVASETYNWPNPIREGRTYLRFELTEPADVSVTIVDLTGTLVDRVSERGAPAGVPVEIVWTTDVGSGVYLARVEAVSSGRTESRLIKMAVIR